MSDATLASHSARPSPRRALWWRTGITIYGALMIVFGVVALLAPLLATYAASVTFGAVLLGSGVLGTVMLVLDWRTEAFVWRAVWSAIAIIGGLCIIIHPWPGALALTLILGASLLAQRLVAVAHAFAHRKHESCPWGQMAFAGAVSAILGALLIWALPQAGLFVPGVFLALNLITFGLSLIAVAISQRTAAQ